MSSQEPSARSSRSTGRALVTLLVLMQVAGLGWLIYRDWETSRIQADYQSMIADMERSLVQATAALDQQSSILDRTIGKIIPVRMPADWSERLVDLERVTSDQDRWPRTSQAAQEYFEATSDLISELPSWAESEYLSRLNVVRWAAMVFTTINPPENSEVDVHARAETLAALSESAPDGISGKLLEHVDSEQGRLVVAADEADWQQLRQRAANYLTEHAGTSSLSPIQQDVAFLLAYSESAEESRRDEAEQLLRELQKITLRLEAEQQVESLKSRIASLMTLKEKDTSLYEAGLGLLLGEVRSSRITLALSGLDLESLDQIDSKLFAQLQSVQLSSDRAQQAEDARNIRAYQQYALDRIKHFGNRYRSRGDIATETLKRIREGRRDVGDYVDLPSVCHAIQNARYEKVERQYWWDGVGYQLEGSNEDLKTYIEYRVCRDALVGYLLPIDNRLLEIPVHEMFMKSWNEGWNTLDGRLDQNFVAEQSAYVKKKTLADLREEQR